MRALECRLINASIACYAIKDGSLPADNPNLKALGLQPGTKPTVFVNGPEQINAGFVAEIEDGWVVLALRGTLPPFNGNFWAWVDDWLQDFEAGPTDWIVNGQTFGRVETGFADALLSIWGQVESAIAKIDLTSKQGILITGHSKGAAMTFLAASLLKSAHPHILIENCCFAAPLTCDATFRTNYDALGLRPFTVRYQNEYDLVPYLPWWPVLALLANAQRRNLGEVSPRLASENWPEAGSNLYTPVGILRYLGPDCVTEYGEKAERDAWDAMKYALDHLEFEKIVDAHSASGRYLKCVCG
ncbi:lipase family protein [Microbulbifer sp. SAOS-129_SWC]|uniref:lipase family protein n=1 Tax=Microbulbifer sp. SAOS-129_SWC TaxID=3145235 RepID=UPI0032167EB4